MATFKFVFRPSMKTGHHPGSLSLRIIHDRKPKTVSLRLRLYAEEWDVKNQRVMFPSCISERSGYLRSLDARICSCSARLHEIIHLLENKGAYSVSDVVEHYRESSDESKLLGYALSLSSELRRNGQYRTAKAYITVCRGFVSFNSGLDVCLSQITASLVKRFENHLKENGKQPNTVSYYMRNLRVIYNRAIETKRLLDTGENPFVDVFTGVEETKRRALSAVEVNRLKNINFKSLLLLYRPGSHKYLCIRNLYFSWRLFFFCLYAQGMCFVDLVYLKKSQIKDGILRYYRKKTGKQICVPVNEGMQRIIDSFSDDTRDSAYLFPIINGSEGNGRKLYESAMRTQNRRLKKLAEMACVSKIVSTHVARHSWATICKNELLPLSVICEGLGHSSEKMTRKYLDSFDLSILGNAGKTVLSAVSRSSSSSAALDVLRPVPI